MKRGRRTTLVKLPVPVHVTLRERGRPPVVVLVSRGCVDCVAFRLWIDLPREKKYNQAKTQAHAAQMIRDGALEECYAVAKPFVVGRAGEDVPRKPLRDGHRAAQRPPEPTFDRSNRLGRGLCKRELINEFRPQNTR